MRIYRKGLNIICEDQNYENMRMSIEEVPQCLMLRIKTSTSDSYCT